MTHQHLIDPVAAKIMAITRDVDRSCQRIEQQLANPAITPDHRYLAYMRLVTRYETLAGAELIAIGNDNT